MFDSFDNFRHGQNLLWTQKLPVWNLRKVRRIFHHTNKSFLTKVSEESLFASRISTFSEGRLGRRSQLHQHSTSSCLRNLIALSFLGRVVFNFTNILWAHLRQYFCSKKSSNLKNVSTKKLHAKTFIRKSHA